MFRNYRWMPVCAAVLSAGCFVSSGGSAEVKEDTVPETGKTMLADYYERTVGTPEAEPYYELVLYSSEDEQFLLEEYRDGGTEKERVTGYLADADVYERFRETVMKYGMTDWDNGDSTFGIDGQLYVVKFLRNGTAVRVSSEAMPEEGTAAFNAIREVLASGIDESRIVYANYTSEE